MFSDRFGLMVGVVNNWDAMTDWKSQKSVIGQVFVSPAKGWNLYVNYIGGYNDDGFKVYGGPGTRVGNTAYSGVGMGYTRQMIDITTGYQITDKFYVGVNAALGWYTYSLPNDNYEFKKQGGTPTGTYQSPVLDTAGNSVMGYPNATIIEGEYMDTNGDGVPDAPAVDPGNPEPVTEELGSDPDGNGKVNVAFANKGFGSQLFSDSSKYQSWGGIALYTNYKFNDMLGIGVRYEHFDDRNGVRYLNGVNNALTITMPITLADGHLIIKPEFRWDTGVLGYAYSKTANPNGNGGGSKTTTGEGLYETNDEWATKNVGGGASYIPTFTQGQSTIGLAFIYKY